MNLIIQIKDKYIYDIVYIEFCTRTTCYGKYYPRGIDIYIVCGKCRDIKFDTFIYSKFIFSSVELKRILNVQ